MGHVVDRASISLDRFGWRERFEGWVVDQRPMQSDDTLTIYRPEPN
jgi:hypothetical protein